jgi:hypothetical protein
MNLSSSSSHSSEQLLDLHGSTLQIYWYILTQPKKVFSYSEIQKIMGFSSKSSAIYQLEKLCELQILSKTEDGYVLVSRPKPRALQSYFLIRFLIVPKALIYSIILSVMNLSIFLLIKKDIETLPILIASIPNIGAILLFFGEAVFVWKNRPKPANSNRLLRLDLKSIRLFINSFRPTHKKKAEKPKIIRNKIAKRFSLQRISFSGFKIRVLVPMAIILILLIQIFLIGALLGFQGRNDEIHVRTNFDVPFSEPLPIQLKRNGYTFQNQSLYSLGEFRNGTSGIFLFHFEFNTDFTLRAINKHKFPSHIPSLGIGLSFNGNSFWTMEESENQTQSQRSFFFTKDLSTILNYSINLSSMAYSMDIEFSRRDMCVLNDSMWILESWSNSNNDKLYTNVSIYSMETFLQVKTFSVPIDADELFFDNHGHLWLCDFEYYPENQATLITIAPYEGTVLQIISSFTFPSFSLPNQNGDSYFSYYPIIFNDSFLVPIGDDDISNLLGFQIISYEISAFPAMNDFIWILLITFGVEAGLYSLFWLVYSKRKRGLKTD